MTEHHDNLDAQPVYHDGQSDGSGEFRAPTVIESDSPPPRTFALCLEGFDPDEDPDDTDEDPADNPTGEPAPTGHDPTGELAEPEIVVGRGLAFEDDVLLRMCDPETGQPGRTIGLFSSADSACRLFGYSYGPLRVVWTS